MLRIITELHAQAFIYLFFELVQAVPELTIFLPLPPGVLGLWSYTTTLSLLLPHISLDRWRLEKPAAQENQQVGKSPQEPRYL